MNISIKTPLIFLSLGLMFLSSIAHANVYSYISADGSRILTDKRLHGKGYKLVKVYNIKKLKKKAVLKPKARKASYHKTSSKKRRRGNGIVHSCSNKQHLDAKARAYGRTIQVYSKIYGVEEELIHAIVKQESCFNERAHSRTGAIGLMQLMPGTANMMMISDPWNPEQNIQAGVKYIAQMLSLFRGKKRFAVAAYNAGPGKVQKYRGIPPYRETKNYVKKVMAEYHRLKKQGLPSTPTILY
ncbi:MAG: hypothetical protein DSZ29_04850 [Aquificaceae bacterium]|nr:MAG: hypothetical protein DSZ29_04850 [Aquificaceae bacterium]